MANSNIAIDTYRIIWKDLFWRSDLASSQISGRMYNSVVSIKRMMWKVCCSPSLCCYLKQLLISNDRNRVRWVVLGLSEDGACTDLFESLSVNSIKGDLSNAITFNPPLFSLVNTFYGIWRFFSLMFRTLEKVRRVLVYYFLCLWK